ncbi:hypothetical protein M514_05373, partial [Trichuris suis]
MEDSAVRRQVWEGRVPVCFCAAPNEFTCIERPKNIYMLVPRNSYFPLVTGKVFKYIATFVEPPFESEFWLEYNGIPLRWYYPVGLLFDLMKQGSSDLWQITVHVKDYPREELFACSSLQVVEAHFIQTVKQADQIKHRSRVMNSIQKHGQKQLWNAMVTSRFDQFWEVNRLLMQNSEDEPIRHLPIKLFNKDYAFVQRLWPAYKSEGKDGELTKAGDLLKLAGDRLGQLSIDNVTLLCQGITIPAETPLLWLYLNMSCPDNFLYVCALEVNK